jgi:phosphate-selective porin OprO/OprP
MSVSKRIGALLLSGAAFGVFATSAHAAAPSASTDQIAQRLADLQQQIDDLNNTMADLKRGQSAQYADVQNQRAGDIQFSFKNGRFTAKSADGDFSLATRVLVQFDAAYYNQDFIPGSGVTPANTDFSSGGNFRRARLGVSGTLFGNWSYEFMYDLGGSGVEASTVSSAYVQYDGLGQVHLRLGAFPPPESFDDSTSASDLLFLERAQPADLGRSIAGSDGRNGAEVFAYDDNYFAAVTYTAGLTGDAATFDEQQAVVARGAYRFNLGQDINLAFGADTTYTTKMADSIAGAGSPHLLQLRERPELNVDSQNKRLIDTGAIDASHYWEWGLETAGNYQNFYGQGGYFHYDVTRRNSLLTDPDFSGWYAQASWVITGEAKQYKPERGAYGSPVPVTAFGKGGVVAWELAVRYSDLNLNFHEGAALTPVAADGIRGGEQKIWTAGVNWYPNSAIRFVLDYQHTDVTRLNALGGSLNAKLDAVSLRTQLAL